VFTATKPRTELSWLPLCDWLPSDGLLTAEIYHANAVAVLRPLDRKFEMENNSRMKESTSRSRIEGAAWRAASTVGAVVVLLAMLVVSSCSSGSGGGGGNPSAQPSPEVISLAAAPLAGGEYSTITTPSELLEPGAEYKVIWSVGETAIGSSTMVAVTSDRLGGLTPLFPTGSYVCETMIGTAIGRWSVDLTEAPSLTLDPAVVVGQFVADITANLAATQTTVANLSDPTRQAKLQALLDLASGYLALFETGQQVLTPAELATLATILAANPSFATGTGVGGGGWPQAAAQFVANRTVIVYAVGVYALGANLASATESVTTTVGLGMIAGAVRTFVDELTQVDEILAAVSTEFVTAVTIDLPEGGSGTPRLTSGQPQQLSLGGIARSVSEQDRGSSNLDMVAFFAAYDELQSFWAGLPASVLNPLDTEKSLAAPMLADPPIIGTVTLAPEGLQLTSWTNNSAVSLTLSPDGMLAAMMAPGSGITATEVTLTYTTPFTSVTTMVSLEIYPNIPGFVPISAGTYMRGTTLGHPHEGPVHQVTISQPFWMGKHEVTQAEYTTLMGANPSFFSGASLPVEQVSWVQSLNYCAALTKTERAAGNLLAGYEYRLPTEAEWEYACRAGTTTEYNTGNTLTCLQANASLQPGGGSCIGQTRPVGSYAANAWGLHDMHGNVFEWCLDHPMAYSTAPLTDPYESSTQYPVPLRAMRGGSWGHSLSFCGSASRASRLPEHQASSLGFRAVLAPVLVGH